MALPVVVIVGRPNVGKSSLFNWLVGKRISIVDPTAGVTRDRVSYLIEFDDRHIELCDTGGIGIVDMDALTLDVERQIQLGIDRASVVMFVVDGRSGWTPLDDLVAERLRTIKKPVFTVVNKCDDEKFDSQAAEFHKFGYEPVIVASAEQNRGREAIIREIIKNLPDDDDDTQPAEIHLKIAIVGRRNVGKSTFINALTEDERVIVSEVAGTTRDSVDVRFERDGKTFVAIDTAGVRNRSSLANNIEFYSLARAERSIRRADVVLHFIDCLEGVGRLDKQLVDYIQEHNKPVIFVVNKWDLGKEYDVTTGEYGDYMRKQFPMLDYVPIAFTTAKSGRNIFKVLNLAQQLAKQAAFRAGTGTLNRIIRAAVDANPPVQRQNRLPKILFVSQVAVSPPTVLVFVNNPDLFDPPYVRYLLNTLRQYLPYAEVPIRLELRNRHDKRPGDMEPDEELFPEEEAVPKKKRDRMISTATMMPDPPETDEPAPKEAEVFKSRKKTGVVPVIEDIEWSRTVDEARAAAIAAAEPSDEDDEEFEGEADEAANESPAPKPRPKTQPKPKPTAKPKSKKKQSKSELWDF